MTVLVKFNKDKDGSHKDNLITTIATWVTIFSVIIGVTGWIFIASAFNND